MPRETSKGKIKAVKKAPLTHFLCVPLVNSTSKSQLEHSINSFKEDVCNIAAPRPPSSSEKDEHSIKSERGTSIADKAVRPVGALHLTLGVMSLDSAKLSEAIQYLQHIDINTLLRGLQHEMRHAELLEPIAPGSNLNISSSAQPATLARPISPPPLNSKGGNIETLTVSLESLISMHPPQKTSILYTTPLDPSHRLQPLCQALRGMFQAAGLLIEDTRPLKLHATIVNTIYVKGQKNQPKKPKGPTEEGKEEEDDRSQGHGPDAKAPLRLDARNVLERYKDFVWAENVRLDRVAICEMGAKKVFNDKGQVVSEEYKEVAVLKLPGA